MSFNVLIIKETDSFCSMLAGALGADGHATLCSNGDREALKIVRIWQPELVILEASTTESGAAEVVERLQRFEETRQVPVIVISDAPELEFELTTVFDFMLKPLDVNRLREDLALLGKGRKRRERSLKREPLDDGDLAMFSDFLVTHSGLHFERRTQKNLERGLANRMTALHIGNYRDYFDYLKRYRESRGELQKLLQYLTVGETYFFRYHAHFDALRRILSEEYASDRGKKVRIWSAGCSTGEEPYSLAITAMEALPDWQRRDLRILATDINNRALKRAREGVYGRWAMRAMEQPYLDRYFDRVGDSYLIKDEVKSLVEFTHLNLQTDQFPARDGEFRALDAIFCRNVTIYFPLATTKKLVEKFATTLMPGGYLFLGHSETLAYVSTRFDRQLFNGGFFYRKREGAGAVTPPAPPSAVERARRSVVKPSPPSPLPPRSEIKPVGPPPVPQASADELYAEAERHFEAEDYVTAARLVDQVLLRDPRHGNALVMKGFVLANKGLFEKALAMCDEALAVNDLLPEAYFLKGLLLDMLDNQGGATEEFRKAILLDMKFVMPRYHLGRLFLRLGKEREGVRELRNSLKILEKMGGGKVVPFSGGLSREVFLGQLRAELARTGS
jgi:chemotaxis protein methyltransferase CheR